MNLTKRLAELVAIDSHSSTDNSPIISLLSQWFEQYPKDVQSWQRKDGVNGKNLVITIEGKSNKKTLVFVGHTDTVPGSNAWTTNPLELVEKDGKLYGLGACDTKGGIAALVEAVLTLSEKPAFTTVLVFDGDEEMNSTGVETYQKSIKLTAPLFICLEPTFRQIHIGQRALLKCTLVAKGNAIHAGQAVPGKSRDNNAINKMLHVMQVLIQDAEILGEENSQLLTTNTQNFGLIKGGTARNVFASSCEVVFERRLIETRDPYQEFDRLKELVSKINPDVELVLDQIEAGFLTDSNNSFVKNILSIVKKHYSESKTDAFPAWSEAGVLAKNGPALIMGPGDIAKHAHRADEYVEKQELETYVTIFKEILLQKI